MSVVFEVVGDSCFELLVLFRGDYDIGSMFCGYGYDCFVGCVCIHMGGFGCFDW